MCCFLNLSIILFVAYQLQKGTLQHFYLFPSPLKQIPSIGDVITEKQFNLQITHVEYIKNSKNPSSDFETMHIKALLETKLPIPVKVFDFCDLWIEDEYENKFYFSPAKKENSIMQESEVVPDTQLELDLYFSTPKYAKELYVVLKPKIGGNPIKIKI